MKWNERTDSVPVPTTRREAKSAVPDAADEETSEHLDTLARIRQGLVEARCGLGRSPDAVFDEIARKG
jgi:hypothetical protein